MPTTTPPTAPTRAPRGTRVEDDDVGLGAALAVPAVLVLLGMLFVAHQLLADDDRRSERENRALAAWPAYSFAALRDGRYTRGIDDWVADHFPLRERFLDVASACKDARGFAVDDAVFDASGLGDFGLSAGDVDAGPAVANDADTVGAVAAGADVAHDDHDAGPSLGGVDAGPPSATAVDDGVVVEADAGPPAPRRHYKSGIAIVDDRALMYLVGDDDTARAFARAVNAWADALPEGVRLDVLVTPTATRYYLPAAQADRSLPQRENLEVMRRLLRPSVHWVDVDQALADHVDEEIFFRTDHHWTALGAFYAYAAWATQAGFTPVALEGLQKRTRPPSLGSLYRTTQSSALARRPEAADYWVPDVAYRARRWRSLDAPPLPVSFLFEHERGYNVFLGGDDPLFVAEVDNHAGRRALLVKNSYGNAVAPFLLHHFDEVVVVDYRYYGRSVLELVKKHRITDVIIVNATVTANSRPHARRLQEVLVGRGAAWAPVRPESSAPPTPTTGAAGEAAPPTTTNTTTSTTNRTNTTTPSPSATTSAPTAEGATR